MREFHVVIPVRVGGELAISGRVGQRRHFQIMIREDRTRTNYFRRLE
jgi:hypothetical protein